MKSGLYGLRKGHKNRIFILLFNSLLPTLGNAGSRLLKSRIKIRFLCPFLRPYKPDFISQHLYLVNKIQTCHKYCIDYTLSTMPTIQHGIVDQCCLQKNEGNLYITLDTLFGYLLFFKELYRLLLNLTHHCTSLQIFLLIMLG